MNEETMSNSGGSKRPQVYSSYIQDQSTGNNCTNSLQQSRIANMRPDQTYIKPTPHQFVDIKKPRLNETSPQEMVQQPLPSIPAVGVDTFESENVFVVNKDYALVRMDCIRGGEGKSMFCFKGRCSVALLHGCLGISGYTFERQASESRTFKWHDLFSPETNSFLTITCKTPTASPNSPNTPTLIKQIKHLTAQPDLPESELASFLDKAASLFLIRNLDSTLCHYLNYIDNFKQVYLDKPLHSSDSDSMLAQLGLFPISREAFEGVHVASEEEKAVCKEIGDWPGPGAPVVMACGGKDVGKSTFLRYLVNSLLNKYKTVAYLDCDPGQCEFTLSGCISLSQLNTPIFGPPHTHLTLPKQAHYYLGHLSPGDTPAHYLNCVSSAYQAYLALCKTANGPVPLLVNTMGWNQGLGLCLLKDILLECCPTHVVQIDHMLDVNKNMPVLDKTWLAAQNKFKTVKEVDAVQWKRQSPDTTSSSDHSMQTDQDLPHTKTDHYKHITYKLLTLTSNAPVPKPAKHSPALPTRRYSAKDHRTIATIAYFAPLQTPATNIRSVHNLRPYKVSWSRFALHCAHVRVEFGQMFKVLNGSLVGLCSVDEKHIRRNRSNPSLSGQFNSFDYETKQPVVYNCKGFGIIRGINMETKEFYILTPEEPESLDKVNLLVKGMLNLPSEFLFEQDSTTSSPYMCLADNLQTQKENMIGNAPVQRKYLIHNSSGANQNKSN